MDDAWVKLRREVARLSRQPGVSALPIIACVLREELAARAEAGDKVALARLLALMPKDLTQSARRGERDRRIRSLAERLHAALPGASRHAIAEILAAAGDKIRRGGGLGDAPPFDRLTRIERRELDHEVRQILAWAQTWPRLRQMIATLG